MIDDTRKYNCLSTYINYAKILGVACHVIVDDVTVVFRWYLDYCTTGTTPNAHNRLRSIYSCRGTINTITILQSANVYSRAKKIPTLILNYGLRGVLYPFWISPFSTSRPTNLFERGISFKSTGTVDNSREIRTHRSANGSYRHDVRRRPLHKEHDGRPNNDVSEYLTCIFVIRIWFWILRTIPQVVEPNRTREYKKHTQYTRV